MADVGKKVAPCPFQLMHLRDVTRHQQQVFLAVRHHADFQMATGVEHQIQRLAKLLFFKILRKFRVAQQVKDILPAVVRPAQTQHLLRQPLHQKIAPSSVVRITASGSDSAPLRKRLIRLPSSRRRFLLRICIWCSPYSSGSQLPVPGGGGHTFIDP